MKYTRLLFVVLLPVLFAAWFARYREAVVYYLDTLKALQRVKKAKDTPTVVVSKPILKPWPKPKSSQVLFDGSTRILWGYWDAGQEAMPALCQLAVKSWKTRNPDWHVIILSDANYKTYVSASDLPTTFDSLKVQHKSDILRLGVLVRYGGAYMDVSTIVLKGFDDIWKTAFENQVFFTSTLTLQDSGMQLVNNALILSPTRENPVLRDYHRKLLVYAESPVATVEELRSHPGFSRILPLLWYDSSLGILREMLVYGANIWLLNDVLYFDEKLAPFIQEHVYLLPTRRWSFDFFSLPVLGRKSTTDPAEDPPVISWSMLHFLKWALYRVQAQFWDDPVRAQRLVEQVSIMKISTDDVHFDQPMSYYVEGNTTLSRIYRATIQEGPTVQATLDGATPIQPFSNET